jgi:hypothetical protein
MDRRTDMKRKKSRWKGQLSGSEAYLFADPTIDLLERERMRTGAADIESFVYYYSFGIHADGVGADARVEIELNWMCEADDHLAAAPRMAELLDHWRTLDVVKEIEVEEIEEGDEYGETLGQRWDFKFSRPVLAGKPSFPFLGG